MNKTVRFAKYQLSYYTIAVIVFYGITVLLALLTYSPGGGNAMAGTGVFVFVLGLNWFKPSFLFSQANNLPRRVFYLGTVLAIFALTLVMSLATSFMDAVLRSGVKIGLFAQIYPLQILPQLLWTWASLIASAGAGLMISMLYYRSSPPVKIAISVSPVFFGWLLGQIERRSNGGFGLRFLELFKRAFGIAGEVPNPYPAILSFIVLAMIFLTASAVLLHRAPVKN